MPLVYLGESLTFVWSKKEDHKGSSSVILFLARSLCPKHNTFTKPNLAPRQDVKMIRYGGIHLYLVYVDLMRTTQILDSSY